MEKSEINTIRSAGIYGEGMLKSEQIHETATLKSP